MTALIVLAVICGIIGIIGSIVPGLPGPPVSWVGMLFAFFYRKATGEPDRITLSCLLIWLAITVIVSILDYVIPAKFTKLTGGSKAASTGSILGLIAGLIFPPIGMIMGALLGAFLAEMLVQGSDVLKSAKAAVGAFLGFLCGTGMKLIASGLMMYYILA